MDKDKITYFAQTDARNKQVPFGIRADDRTRHVYVIGKTGMGKSVLLENMAVQDIQNGNGLAFIDPHGKTADLLLEYVPKDRIKDVIYFAPFDTDHPVSINVMEDVDPDKRHLVVTGLMSAFKKIWIDAFSARMEYILNNCLLALLEYPDSTLLGVNRMLTDKDYRKKVVDNVTDPSVKSYWVDEFAKYTDKYTQEATPAIQNKIGQFTGNPLIRNIIGQPKSSFDIRQVMDEKKILIINLSKGRIGEGNANLLGSMLITKIYLAAMSRADLSETELKRRPNFYMYVDEFQSFANESFANILSEARKYNLNLTIAHQYIEQMSDEVRAAVFGNAGTMISFRVGAYDAEVLEKEFAPVFTATDMVSLGFTQIYLKLMIKGVTSHPFSATTLPPIKRPEVSSMEAVIESSRRLYAQPRTDVETAIKNWYTNAGGAVPVPKEAWRAGTFTPAPTPTPAPSASAVKPTAPSSTSATTPAPLTPSTPIAPVVQKTAPPIFPAVPLVNTTIAQPTSAPTPTIPASASAPAPVRPPAPPSPQKKEPTPSSVPRPTPTPAPVRSTKAPLPFSKPTPSVPRPVPSVPPRAVPTALSLDALKRPPSKSDDPRMMFTENRKSLKEALALAFQEKAKELAPEKPKEEPVTVKKEEAQKTESVPTSALVALKPGRGRPRKGFEKHQENSQERPQEKPTEKSTETQREKSYAPYQGSVPKGETPFIPSAQRPAEVPEDILKKILE